MDRSFQAGAILGMCARSGTVSELGYRDTQMEAAEEFVKAVYRR
jgi:hypothetical protein